MATEWNIRLQARLDAQKSAGLERVLRTASGRGISMEVGGKQVVSFASNDYLGLSTHPNLAGAAERTVTQRGTGAGASRLVCGTKPEHVELEKSLATFKRTQAALTFPSGYHAAQAVIQALAGGKTDGAPGISIFVDRLAHASLLDGAMLAKEWGGASVRTFKHNDLIDLKELLDKVPADVLALVVTESLFSMDGDVAPLKQLYELTESKDALLLVDEAHATGVFGTNGAGALSEIFDHELPTDLISMGTLSKALGSQGGFICASKLIIDSIINSGRAFLFTTALAPVNAAAAQAGLNRLMTGQEETRRLALLETCLTVRKKLTEQGWQVIEGSGPIIPIVIGDEARTLDVFNQLLSAGYWVPAIRFPTVARGQARLRISLSAAHGQSHVDGLLAELQKLKK